MKGPTNSSARPNIRLLNVSAEFVANTDTETNSEFPYRASVTAEGVTDLMSATVMFSQVQAISGNFATFCQTDTDVIYIYSKTDVGTITIPAISCDLTVNYINVDNVPTEDSQAVITSGGVYTALSTKADDNAVVKLTGDQVIGGYKTFKTNIATRSLNALGTADYPYCVIQRDKNDTFLYGVRCAVATNGKVTPYITSRNADGTTRDISLEDIPNKYTVIKSGTGYMVYQMGKIVIVRADYVQPMTITGCPASLGYFSALMQGTGTVNAGLMKIYGDTVYIEHLVGGDNLLGVLIYIAQ